MSISVLLNCFLGFIVIVLLIPYVLDAIDNYKDSLYEAGKKQGYHDAVADCNNKENIINTINSVWNDAEQN